MAREPYIVFYIEADMLQEALPHTVGGDWVASATSPKNALEQSEKLGVKDVTTMEVVTAYAVPVSQLPTFQLVSRWERIKDGN